ncbi:MAG: hypothetical protein BRC58_06025 [Cyanobacteria bacterium QS_8_64_29]|nr:MAG: hypothetical protein BRC58_06025 [Cyanobacteria bacterium QS_8_64_29]
MTLTASDDIAAALEAPADLNFELPDPGRTDIADSEFEQQLERAWQVCERFDLQTDIWRGCILRAVRDREKQGGDGRGTGFVNWLRDRELAKSQAYHLIQLADSADTLLEQGELQPEAFDNFSKRAFLETAKAPPEVQQLAGASAQSGDRVTRREVKQFTDDWTAMQSERPPDELKQKASEGTLPARELAPLAQQLEKLPEAHCQPLQQQAQAHPDAETVKYLTAEARHLAQYLEAAARVQALERTGTDLEGALEEALRLDCAGAAADLVKQAAQLEQLAVKLHASWKRLGGLAERLELETGASNPHLRSLVAALGRLSGEAIEVPLDETGERLVRLQIASEERTRAADELST